MKPRSNPARRFAYVVLAIFCSMNCGAQINSWTKPVSGYWEEPFWSLGVLPSSTQSGVVFNNAGFKALAIGASTVSSQPEALTIINLTVSAPAASLNTLLLNYPGLGTPLQVNDTFYLGSNARVVTYFGGLRVGTFLIDGSVTQSEFAETFAHHASLGQTTAASYRMTNGLLAGDLLQIGAGGSGAFSQYGGGNTITEIRLLANGSTYDLYGGVLAGGLLSVSYNDSITPSAGSARVNQWGGSVQMSGSIAVGNSIDSGSYYLADGDLNAGTVRVGGGRGNGSFYQRIGTNTCVTLRVEGGRLAFGHYFLTNGAVAVTDSLSIAGNDASGDGHFYQYGGVQTSDGISLTGFDNGYDPPGHAGYSLVSGMILSRNVMLGNFTTFSQSGGSSSLSGELRFSNFSTYRSEDRRRG